MSKFNISRFKDNPYENDRYQKRLQSLTKQDVVTKHIKRTVKSAIDNIQKERTNSFIIYGEPQSGKTEMMIALTAKLLDEKHNMIIILLNDSIQLLEQNLERFRRSGLSPSPKNYTEIIDSSVTIQRELVIFCKKNSNNLTKLINKVENIEGKIVIDDEADYATPNASINKENEEKTKINYLIDKLLNKHGIYIGITATPARLDLNNTFNNDNEKWIHFPSHDKYTGQEQFFPLSEEPKFRLSTIPESDMSENDQECLQNAFLGFLATVAYLNDNKNESENYNFLIHTSGRVENHTQDRKIIQDIFTILGNAKHQKYPKYIEAIWEIAHKRFPNIEDRITNYVRKHILRNNIVIMNSQKEINSNYKSATSPSSLFTVTIGGNLVSRGVTFNNLLGMYFTRKVKQKINQDTYIQRARMFGNRRRYLEHFELTIPEMLYSAWHRCFVFHRLSLEMIKKNSGAPVWLGDRRIAPTASSSIDRTNVITEKGEMSFGKFNFDPSKNNMSILTNNASDNRAKLENLHNTLGENCFPQIILLFVQNYTTSDVNIKIHRPLSIETSYPEGIGTDHENVSRIKGFMSGRAFKDENIIHHFRIIHNGKGTARLFYKYQGNIQFLRNLRNKGEPSLTDNI